MRQCAVPYWTFFRLRFGVARDHQRQLLIVQMVTWRSETHMP